MRQVVTDENELRKYLELSPQAMREQLQAIQARTSRPRQETFNEVETLLCYGLFQVVNPHGYGGNNKEKIPEVVKILAGFFRRPATSIILKMSNLDGSQKHGQRLEPLLYAKLAEQPDLYAHLYHEILQIARDMTFGEEFVPDFLYALDKQAEPEKLLGQYELPTSAHLLIREAGKQSELYRVDQVYKLGDRLTEKLVEQRVRLLQNYFARSVLQNCVYTCVFCGFAPHSLGSQSGLLRASHIKPWARSTPDEQIDVRNGLAACPIHDAAFDYGYLAIEDTYAIMQARILQESIARDQGVSPYFHDLLHTTLVLPADAKKPALTYLEYHRLYVFRNVV